MDISEVRDQVESIRREVGLFSGSAFLEQSVEEMANIAADDRIGVDIFLSSACRDLINKNSFNAYPQLNIHLYAVTSQLGCSVGLRKAPVGIFVCLNEEFYGALQDQAVWNYFRSGLDQYAARRLGVIGASQDGDSRLNTVDASVPDGVHVIHAASSNDLASVLVGLDTAQFARQASMYKLLSAAPVVSRVKSVVSSEVAALTLRRQIIVSEQDRSRRTDQGYGNDAQSLVRNLVQKNFQDTERLFRQKYDELCRPNVGVLAQLIASHADSLGANKIMRIDKAANFEKFEARIDAEYLKIGVAKLQKAFREEMDKDAVYIKQLAQDTESGVGTALQHIGFKGDALSNMVRPQLDLSKLDQSHFRITKDYKGELTKPGVMEYFGALRDYTGLIMVIVGILAPLTMLATAPDADKGSVLESINEFSGSLKNIRAYIQFFTIILIFSMLSYGIFDLRRRIPNKRRQELEKEVGEAREFVSEQLTRLLSDAHRDWSGVLGQYVKDYSQALQTEVDALLKKHANTLQQTATERRSAAVLEQSSVEHKLKSFAIAERTVENLVRRFQDGVDRMQTALASRVGAAP